MSDCSKYVRCMFKYINNGKNVSKCTDNAKRMEYIYKDNIKVWR